MRKYDKGKNVYDAACERYQFIFENFERIYLSFSGGKDSGVMLNMALQYQPRYDLVEEFLRNQGIFTNNQAVSGSRWP